MTYDAQCPACEGWGGNHSPLGDFYCVRKALERHQNALCAIRQKAFDYLKGADVQKGRISVAGVAFLYDIMRDATTALKDGGLKE